MPARSWREPVADPPDRFQELRVGRVTFELLSQAADVDGECAGVERRGVAPNAAHQIIARENPPRVAGEEPEEVELLRRQPDGLTPARDLARPGVQHETVVLQSLLGGCGGLCSAQNR